MRTNIVIDPSLMDAAWRAGPYKTRKDAAEAGLRLLARQAAYRDVLRWEGQLPLAPEVKPPQRGRPAAGAAKAAA